MRSPSMSLGERPVWFRHFRLVVDCALLLIFAESLISSYKRWIYGTVVSGGEGDDRISKFRALPRTVLVLDLCGFLTPEIPAFS